MKLYLCLVASMISACSGTDIDRPLANYDLLGWTGCSSATQALPSGTGEACLAIDETGTRYQWSLSGGQCLETGALSGALEFDPDTASRLCFAPDYSLYSAAGSWTATGILLVVDSSPSEDRAAGLVETTRVRLNYVP